MKTQNLILSIALTAFFAVSCSTTNSSDNYFGYTNKPKVAEETPVQQTLNPAPADAWTNPMGGASSNAPVQEVAVRSEDLRRNDYDYNRTVYVPVIVPWWSNHYGWVSSHYHGRRYYHMSSAYWGFGWYSPWYDYHPYYGRYWDPWSPWYSRGWYSQPVYTYSNNKPNKRDTYRSFGANRGTYTYDDRSSRNQSTPRPSGQSGTVTTGTVERVSGSAVRVSESGYNRTDASSGGSTSSRGTGTTTRPSSSTGNVFRVVETESRPASEPVRTSGSGIIRNVGETQSSPSRTTSRPVESAPVMRDAQPSSSGSSAPSSSPDVRSGSSGTGSSTGTSSGSSSGSSRSGSSSGSSSGKRTR